MGADLVGYITKFKPRKIEEAKQEVRAILTTRSRKLIAFLDKRGVKRFAELDDHFCDDADFEEICDGFNTVDEFNDEEDFGDFFDEILDGLAADDIDSYLDEICTVPLDARDVMWRHDPDATGHLMVAAGERTWGDSPDGQGYQFFRQAYRLGIEATLGIR